jgi:radical SAM protein with 4Fe4S-binding SPASM domain
LSDRIIAGVEKIIDLKPPRLYVTISIDGPEHTHDSARGIKGSWRNAVNTFIALKGMPGVNPYVSMTLSQGNLGTIDETIDSLRSAYHPFKPDTMMNFNFFQRSSHYYGNDNVLAPNEDLLLKDIKKAKKVLGGRKAIKNYLQINYLNLYHKYLKTGKSPLPCQALSASCFMDPYGNVFPCSVYDKKAGNIREVDYDLAKLWNKQETEALHYGCKSGKCPGCWSPCEAYQAINGNLFKLRFISLNPEYS